MEINEVMPNLIQVQTPLPNSPLKATNNYYIRGKARDLWIDTAFNHEICKQAMDETLKILDVDMARTDIFATHLHADHCGLIGYMAKPSTRIFASRKDGEVFGDRNYIPRYNRLQEFADKNLSAPGGGFNIFDQVIFTYRSDPFDNEIIMLNDTDTLSIGGFEFECVLTPGHTDGHMCLYDHNKKLLISGDHVLPKITPNITLWDIKSDALGDYLNSLDKIKKLNAEKVLPGHRYIFEDCNARMDVLRAHHERRMQEVLDIIGGRKMTAYEVAPLMKWDISCKNWDDFPPAQKIFATGEAMSHLRHLAALGKLKLIEVEGYTAFQK
jgi:glyoxylase-like metal-dependent hydrolase (beta-lactamase superfamily II)